MIEALQFDFMRNALLAGLLVSIACGIIGAFVVLNRIVFISGGIAHAAYGGVGLGYFFGFSPILGAVGFSLLAALGMGLVQRHTRQRADTLIGVLWAIGMATGIILIDLTPGYKADLLSYLFGSILAVPTGDLWLMLGLDLVIVALVALLYKELLALSFDETYATVANVPVGVLSLLLIGLIALTVVMLMRVIGLILLIALLTIPAAIAGQFVRDMRAMLLLAGGPGMLFTTLGLWLSYTLNLTSGATIILVSAAAFLVSLGLRALTSRSVRATGSLGHYAPMSHPPLDEIVDLARAQIAARGAAEQASDNIAAARRDQRWGVAFLLFLSALLLAGQQALGTMSGRISWISQSLSEPGRVEPVHAALEHLVQPQFDTVLSTTALHWLPIEHLTRVYNQLGELVRPGGLLLNGDHMAYPATLPAFRSLADRERERIRPAAFSEQGGEDYRQWRQAIEQSWLAADSALQSLFDAYPANEQLRRREFSEPIALVHVAALSDAGFDQVDTIWQCYDNRVLMAVRGQPTAPIQN
jgi:zinc transport system permease protein